jgi:hypothetical protein
MYVFYDFNYFSVKITRHTLKILTLIHTFTLQKDYYESVNVYVSGVLMSKNFFILNCRNSNQTIILNFANIFNS